MTQLSFRDDFKPLILSGAKRQTIRENKGKPHRIKVGDTIHFMNGGYVAGVKREFAKSTCINICSIDLTRLTVRIDGVIYSDSRLQSIAVNDGFNNYEGMWQWFVKTYKLNPTGGAFKGWLIMWGDLQ